MDPLVGIWTHVEGSAPKYRWAFDSHGQAFFDNNMRGTWRAEETGYVIEFPGYQSRGYLIGNHVYQGCLQSDGLLTLAWRKPGGEWDPKGPFRRLGPVNGRLDWELADELRGFRRKPHPYND